ncbi:response regulator [Dictyobacter arantiisoli]|uniref:Response regulatory domain-containing protein n=1 Tax=Dictyobacter arantiisoli TaxID=2014874 RepID=A0A5A5TCK9_9CHLR|nr:response regulator [Dictyobacter arantiisoli]GCF08925.1 hypothetical protein KDI_24890 [Dictyobacter arantiisoli]
MTDREPAHYLQEGKSFLVLIVDDEDAIIDLLSDFVTDLGYTPSVAQNGQQAMERVYEHWPALVITDFMMPKLNGADLVRALHVEAVAQRRLPPPIILLTAVGVPALKDLPVDVVMAKPFDLDQLENVIRRLLQATFS